VAEELLEAEVKEAVDPQRPPINSFLQACLIAGVEETYVRSWTGAGAAEARAASERMGRAALERSILSVEVVETGRRAEGWDGMV
jgi:hypothetical protein